MTNGDELAFPSDPKARIGLTKREYFAAMAMQGLCADPQATNAIDVAYDAVKTADALIAELNK